MMRTAAVAALVLVHSNVCSSHACHDSAGVQEQCEDEPDETVLLAIASKVLQAPVAAQGKSEGIHAWSEIGHHSAGNRLSLFAEAFKRNPVETLNKLNEMLTVTMMSLEEDMPKKKTSHIALISSDVQQKDCGGRKGPCWTKAEHAAAAANHQPHYPFDPLLDVDFVENAGNWLDQWRPPKVPTGKPLDWVKDAVAKGIGDVAKDVSKSLDHLAKGETHKKSSKKHTKSSTPKKEHDGGLDKNFEHDAEGTDEKSKRKAEKSLLEEDLKSQDERNKSPMLGHKIKHLQNTVRLLLERLLHQARSDHT